jgi:hypothetical protein
VLALSLRTIYVPKLMRAHGQMQATVPVNRRFWDRLTGFIGHCCALAHKLRQELATVERAGHSNTAMRQAQAVPVRHARDEVGRTAVTARSAGRLRGCRVWDYSRWHLRISASRETARSGGGTRCANSPSTLFLTAWHQRVMAATIPVALFHGLVGVVAKRWLHLAMPREKLALAARPMVGRIVRVYRYALQKHVKAPETSLEPRGLARTD